MLKKDKIYYARVRHQGMNNSVSVWSEPLEFEAKGIAKPNFISGLDVTSSSQVSEFQISPFISSTLTFLKVETQTSLTQDFASFNTLETSEQNGYAPFRLTITENQIHYLRFRYHSQTGTVSEWSNIKKVTFQTQDIGVKFNNLILNIDSFDYLDNGSGSFNIKSNDSVSFIGESAKVNFLGNITDASFNSNSGTGLNIQGVHFLNTSESGHVNLTTKVRAKRTTDSEFFTFVLTANNVFPPYLIEAPSLTGTKVSIAGQGDPSHPNDPPVYVAPQLYFKLKASEFVANWNQTHTGTDWQVSTVDDFSSLYQNTVVNIGNLLELDTNTLQYDNRYYSRVRFRSQEGAIGEWSQSFILYASDPTISDPTISDPTLLSISREYIAAVGNAAYPNGLPPYRLPGRVGVTAKIYTFDSSRIFHFRRSESNTGGGANAEKSLRVQFKISVNLRQNLYINLGSYVEIPANSISVSVKEIQRYGSLSPTAPITQRFNILTSGISTVHYRNTGSGGRLDLTIPFVSEMTVEGEVYSHVFDTHYLLSSVFRQVSSTGNPSYPNGLPVYKASVPASSKTSTIVFSSENFTISGTNINQTVFPWEKYGYGSCLDVMDQVIAAGCERKQDTNYPSGGEVLVRRKNGNDWTPYRVTIPKTSPFPFFGKSVKLWANGNRLMVGAPGHNKVHQFNFGSNIYNEGRVYSVPNIADGANFGISIDIAPNDSVMAIGAPGALGTGAIYIYSLNGNSFDESGVINITGLQNGETIGHKVRIVNNNRVFSIVRNANNTNSYVAEFIYNESGNWEMRKAFFNPTPNSNDGYAEDFDIPDTFDMMYISAKGNITTKGQVHIWLQAGGEWLYYKSLMDPNGTFGNGFGKALAINADGKAGHILSSNLNEGKLGYYK